MGGFSGQSAGPGTGGSGSGAKLGTRLAYASPAGAAVAAAPAGFAGTVGVLVVSTGAGNAAWISLTNGVAGQLLVVRNTGPNILTLTQAGFGSIGDMDIPSGGRELIYYDSTDGWEKTST